MIKQFHDIEAIEVWGVDEESYNGLPDCRCSEIPELKEKVQELKEKEQKLLTRLGDHIQIKAKYRNALVDAIKNLKKNVNDTGFKELDAIVEDMEQALNGKKGEECEIFGDKKICDPCTTRKGKCAITSNGKEDVCECGRDSWVEAFLRPYNCPKCGKKIKKVSK